MTCCRCCDGSARAATTLQNYRDRIAAGGQPVTDMERLWFAHPENVCWCPDADRADWCRCRHCLSWLRRAPRCHLQDCTLPATHPWSQSTKTPPRCIVHEREHLERQRAASRRARSIRTPPRPPHEATKGTCSMCGTSPLPGRRRSWCSDTCVDLWNLAASAHVAKHQLLVLHGHVCWGCGETTDVLELEHVRPLWSLTDEERTELRWWLPYNLQLLCEPCHRAKSANEAGRRAAAKKSATT